MTLCRTAVLAAAVSSGAFGSQCRCAPGAADFPTCFDELNWESFAQSLQGRFVEFNGIKLPQDVDANAVFSDPQFLTHAGPGFTTFSGVANGWDRAGIMPRAAVEVASVSDVQATVGFATVNNLRLVVKATGHDFHARSAAPGSLVIWTHKLNQISWSSGSFCGTQHKNVVQVGAGVQFWQLYSAAQARNRFVAGGTCSTVGHVGFTTGGGYGVHAKYMGSGAANVLQAEVVLASGESVTATACNEYADLLKAIRGGGAGYGVITSLSYLTHKMPTKHGYIIATAAGPLADLSSRLENVLSVVRNIIQKNSFQNIDGFVEVGTDGAVYFNMKYINMNQHQCEELFAGISFIKLECRQTDGPWWPPTGKPSSQYGPDGNWYESWESSETSKFWAQNQARFFKLSHFSDAPKAAAFAQHIQAFVESWSGNADGYLQLAFQYGLGHGHPRAVRSFADTSVHSDVADAVGTLKLVRYKTKHLGDLNSLGDFVPQQQDAHRRLDEMLGATGAYLNEAAFDQPDWKNRFWGSNVQKLEVVKAKYDPNGLLVCHNCIGSDQWDESGNCRVGPVPAPTPSTPVPPPVPTTTSGPGACTGEGQDPNETGSHIPCCAALAEQLGEWAHDGRWFYQCLGQMVSV